MIQIDIVSLFFIVCMLMCLIIIPLGEKGPSDKEYKALKKKYKQQKKEYLELMDVFERIEIDEL